LARLYRSRWGSAAAAGSATAVRQTTLGGAWWWTIAALVGWGGGELTVPLCPDRMPIGSCRCGLLPSPQLLPGRAAAGPTAAASGVELVVALGCGQSWRAAAEAFYLGRGQRLEMETLALVLMDSDLALAHHFVPLDSGIRRCCRDRPDRGA